MRKPKGRLRRAIEQFVISRIAWLFGRLVKGMSLRACRRVADSFAWLLGVFFTRRMRLADRNIAAAFPEMSPTQRKAVRVGAVRNIARTMIELLKMAWLSPEELAQLVRFEGLERIRAAREQGRGILLLTAHYGNWEVMGAALTPEFGQLSVIARDAPHGLTATLINQARERHNMRVLAQTDVREIVTTLKSGGLLGVLPDQHAAAGGVLLDFLGRPAWVFTGPATMAMRTGAAVVPGFCVRGADGNLIAQVGAPIEMADTGDREADVLENTRRISGAIEQAIREHPDMWLWLHDRWKTVHEAQ
jgi:Kdo2-lipid IVA lauroyltransferase/acyltransferase